MLFYRNLAVKFGHAATLHIDLLLSLQTHLSLWVDCYKNSL